MQVPITLRNRARQFDGIFGRTAQNCTIIVDAPNGTIGDLAQLIADKFDVPSDCLVFLMCGKRLTLETSIEDLFLGPQTSLNAIVVEPCVKNAQSLLSTNANDDKSRLGSFQVFCKSCGDLRRGKLRIYCTDCFSSSVIVLNEPTCWNDVLNSSSIRVDCKDCDLERQAQFCFKCIACNEIAVPLMHIRGSKDGSCCVVCDDTAMKIIAELDCHHQTCIDCFRNYINNAFEDRHQFRCIPPHGYTLTCPVYGCQSSISDAHCFYLLGNNAYQEYQKRGAENFVSQMEEGVFCPRVECGAAFLLEVDQSNPKILCPECNHFFCVLCRESQCACIDADATRKVIERTCRLCPSCGVPTERNGGCAHMHCPHCGSQWCFICSKPWSGECQWDHWFD